jgi:hypothetical protein
MGLPGPRAAEPPDVDGVPPVFVASEPLCVDPPAAVAEVASFAVERVPPFSGVPLAVSSSAAPLFVVLARPPPARALSGVADTRHPTPKNKQNEPMSEASSGRGAERMLLHRSTSRRVACRLAESARLTGR